MPAQLLLLLLICTHKEKGTVGIDITVDHIALVELDCHGNLIHTESFPFNTYGKSSEQSEALIGDVAAKVVKHVKDVQKPIFLEDLDSDEDE